MENEAISCLLANSPDAAERFEAIRRHVLTICTYDKSLPDGWSHSTPDLDLDAAYMLHGTAVAYDWDGRFDLNGDGEVGFRDFLILAAQFGRRNTGN